MNKKRNYVAILMIAVMVFITACGGNKSGNDSGIVTIEFMHSSVEQERLEVINQLVAKFEGENPDIKIKQVPVEEGSYNTKVVTLANANKLPAVLEIGQEYAKVMDKDQLIDKDAVSSVISSIGEDHFYDGALKLLKTEDGLGFTGVPLSGWVQGIWYNKEMLDSKGFSEPANWDEVLEIAKAFNNPSAKQFGIAIPTAESGFSEQVFSQFALSNNANILDSEGNLTLRTAEMHEAITYYQELAKLTMPGSNDVTEIKDAFMSGATPMALYSTYILPSVYEEGLADNIGFAIPTQSTKAVFGTVSALTISSVISESEKAAAEKFITFMIQPENMTTWVLMSPGGAQPVSQGVVDNEVYQANEVINAFGELPKEIAAAFNDIQVFGLVGDKNFLKMGDITSTGAIAKLINSITVSGKQLEQEFNNAEKTIESVLK